MSIMPPSPDNNPDIRDAFYAGALEALDFAWSAVHVMRFAADDGEFKGPDSFYAGVVKSRVQIDNLRRELRDQRDEAV